MTFFSDYNNLALLGIALVSGGLLAWPALTRRTTGASVSIAEATRLINKHNAVVVDIRDAVEYAAGHLPQAKSAPLAELAGKVGSLAKNKANPIIVVCQTGKLSGKAHAAIKEAGYSEVYSLDGGINAWRLAGLPLVK